MPAATPAAYGRTKKAGFDPNNLVAEHPNLLLRHRDVLAGLPVSAVRQFEQKSGFTTRDICEMTGIAYSTLARRKSSPGGLLTPDESDRLARAMRMFQRAREMMNDDDNAARRWLTKPHFALGGQTPVELVRTESGALQVESVIFRVMNGVYI